LLFLVLYPKKVLSLDENPDSPMLCLRASDPISQISQLPEVHKGKEVSLLTTNTLKKENSNNILVEIVMP